MDQKETMDLFQEVDTHEKVEISAEDEIILSDEIDSEYIGDEKFQNSENDDNQKFNKKQRFIREVLSYVFIILLAYVIATLISKYIFTIVSVEQSSMEPTLKEGNTLLLWRLGDLERYDIVVFEDPRKPGEYLIKRLIGLPGDYIELKGGILFLNGEPLDEDYTKDRVQYKDDYTMENICGFSKATCSVDENGHLVIPEGYYFVLGDNRNISIDSDDKEIGLVKEELFEGRIIFRFKGGFGRLK